MDYHIAHKDGTSSGPFDKNELIANGVTRETLVWRQGMSGWLPAHQLQELNELWTESTSQTIILQNQIKEARKEIAQLRKQIAELQSGENATDGPPPLLEASITDKTRYDFPCPTWIKEACIVLACVAAHFLLGITRITTFYYIFFDLIGFALCFAALYIGFRIKALNKISYAQGTPTREKGNHLAKINGWLVSVTVMAGIIIIMAQSGSDMLSEGISTLISYVIIYLMFMGVLWYLMFMPNKTDGYSLQTSPTLKANASIKKLNQDITRRSHRKGYDNDSDDYDDSDWDSCDDDDDDWDWGGGDSGGGGASSDW